MRLLLILVIFIGVIFQNVTMWKTGGEGGYWGPLARDGVWHEALVGQLSKTFPPQIPGFAGVSLTNYHYFYDTTVAAVSAVTQLPVRFVIYRLFPFIFSILLGAGTYLLTHRLFKSKFVSILATFFTYFGSSFGWIVELLKRGSIWGGESAFWANQPVSMNLNPPFAISLVIVIFIILLLDSYLKKQKLLTFMFLTGLSGLLIGFKVYAGIIVISALGFLAFKKLFFEKDFRILPVFVGAMFISLLIYLFQSKGAVQLLLVQPFWLIDTMIDAGDRVGIPNFTARRFAYLSGGKFLNLALLEIVCFLIFFLGNLGTRVVGFLGVEKKHFKSDLHLFMIIAMGVSFIPTLIFVQKGNPWNIVQFLYYFLYFSSLWAAYFIAKLPRALIVIIILVTPISSLATFRSGLYPNPVAYLPGNERAALEFLSNQSDGTILKHPFDTSLRSKFKDPYPLLVYADSAYVSAYSRKRVYLEDVEQQIVLGTNYRDRLADSNRFFVEKNLDWSNNFLKDSGIKYLYLPKIYQLPMAEQEYSMSKIFENDGVNIYKVL